MTDKPKIKLTEHFDRHRESIIRGLLAAKERQVLCSVCGKRLSEARLKAMPSADTCVPCLDAAGDVVRYKQYDDNDVATVYTHNSLLERRRRRLNRRVPSNLSFLVATGDDSHLWAYQSRPYITPATLYEPRHAEVWVDPAEQQKYFEQRTAQTTKAAAKIEEREAKAAVRAEREAAKLDALKAEVREKAEREAAKAAKIIYKRLLNEELARRRAEAVLRREKEREEAREAKEREKAERYEAATIGWEKAVKSFHRQYGFTVNPLDGKEETALERFNRRSAIQKSRRI